MLRINVWISHEGLKETACTGLSFPYKAKCPSDAKKRLFEGIDDVYTEIMNIYEATEKQGMDIGKALYSSCGFFADYELLVDADIQNTIKEYNYCKTFSTPPYPSMQETPARLIDDFMSIEHESSKIREMRNKEANNGK